MVEEIEEILQEKFKKLKIEVEYVKIKMYIINFGNKTILYEWKDDETFSSNINQIEYLIKFFSKENKK